MSLSNSQTLPFRPELSTHVHIDAETCPVCGQEIPPDKFEEISGKIAAREREQTIAITAQLETQYATEKAEAEAKAKADLEAERQRSATREVRIREEAENSAEVFLNEKLAEAERVRQESMAGLQQQVTEAESARKSAEQLETSLRDEIAEMRQTSARAIEAAKAEAKEREAEIRNEAKRTAESALAERISAIEAGHKESESALQARINEAEASRIAAEQKGNTLASQIEDMRKANEDEIAKVKEEAAMEAVRIRQDATEGTELRLRDIVAAHEKAVAEANSKAREAERHASEIEERLTTQREVMEKATEDAVNSEKAKVFQETQKLSNKVNELQRALEKKTADELGEGAEVNLFEALKAEFPDDRIERIAKGAPGADIRHVVMLRGKECGTILYDSKNRKKFGYEYVSKLKGDQLAASAEHAILSTNKFPQGTQQIHVHDGIVLANPARVVSIASILRQHVLQLHTMRLSNVERDGKTAALYEFITSEQCTQILDRIDERASDLIERQAKEIRWHQANWSKQGEAIRAIQKAKGDLENQISSIIGTSDESATYEAS